MTTSEAAKRAKVMLSYIYALIASGKIKAKRVDGRWAISEDEFNNWMSHRKTVNEPEKVTA